MSDWFSKPFGDYLAFFQEADRVLHMSMNGIVMASRQVQALQAIDSYDQYKAKYQGKPYSPKDFAAAQIEADFAKKELDRDFPLLHAHTLVTIWSAAEALFEDVLVAHIIHKPEILKEEVFRKIKIPLAVYEQLNSEDKARLLVYELQRNLNSEQRLGLDCFETLLKVVGLDGKVEDNIRRNIYELQQLRHTIVHRASLADRKLIEACPWLKFTVGERILISHEHYRRLVRAVDEYVAAVLNRAIAIEAAKKNN